MHYLEGANQFNINRLSLGQAHCSAVLNAVPVPVVVFPPKETSRKKTNTRQIFCCFYLFMNNKTCLVQLYCLYCR